MEFTVVQLPMNIQRRIPEIGIFGEEKINLVSNEGKIFVMWILTDKKQLFTLKEGK